jgi:hypothetical protein
VSNSAVVKTKENAAMSTYAFQKALMNEDDGYCRSGVPSGGLYTSLECLLSGSNKFGVETNVDWRDRLAGRNRTVGGSRIGTVRRLNARAR